MTAGVLDDLIAEAAALAGGPCGEFHEWRSDGGRACPRNADANASQTAYRCRRCGEYDYGDPGGPGHRDCIIEGPCDPSCEPPPCPRCGLNRWECIGCAS